MELKQARNDLIVALDAAIAARKPVLDRGERRALRIPEREWGDLRQAILQLCRSVRGFHEPAERALIRLKHLVDEVVPRDRIDVLTLRSLLVTQCIKGYYETDETLA